MLRHARVDRRTPLGAIFDLATAYHVKVNLLKCAANRADFLIANRAMIDANNRRNLGASATHEYFICAVEFGAINLAFACDAAKLASCQLHDRLTRNPQQNILARSWGDQFTIDD